MHPFCCISTVSDNNHISHKPFTDHFPNMPPPSANMTVPSVQPDPMSRSMSSEANHNHINNITDCTETNQRLSQRAEPVDVKINHIVGNGIAGVLQKWVNYGKGWRPRWFLLQDGVLSYYKIHGPDKIVVSEETEKGCKIIGEESMRRISRHNRKHETASQRNLNRKPFGEVHLKVSSIRESKSDDKRFSIFTGTKRLHLRSETREDRLAWMEALQAVKDMFPRMSNSELMAPIDNIQVSTEKLRQRLIEEGLRDAAIQDSEQIMKTEFAAMQSQLLLLKQKHLLLIDTLRHLEVHLKKIRNRIRNSTTTVSPANAK
jgi:oxysterol-binding protein 1